MGIFEDFNNEHFARTGYYYQDLSKANKAKALDAAEQILEQMAARRRAIIRQLRSQL